MTAGCTPLEVKLQLNPQLDNSLRYALGARDMDPFQSVQQRSVSFNASRDHSAPPTSETSVAVGAIITELPLIGATTRYC